MEYRHLLPAAPVQSVLEDDPEWQSNGCDGTGNANVMLYPRFDPSRKNRFCSRRDNATTKRIRTSSCWESLLHHSKARTRAGRQHGHDDADRSFGGIQTTSRRSSSKGSFIKTVGYKERLGAKRRRRQGQDKRKRFQGQVKGQRRAWATKGGSREGKEVSREMSWEPKSSEAVGAAEDYWELSDSVVSASNLSRTEGVLVDGESAGHGPAPYRCPASWPDSSSPETSEGPTGLLVGREQFFTVGRCFGDLAEPLHEFLLRLDVCSDGLHSRVQSSGGIFPLPENPRVLSTLVPDVSEAQLGVLRGVCRALNSYYGVAAGDRPTVSSATRLAIQGLAGDVRDSGLCAEKFEGVSWEQFLEVRGVDYRGEEIKVAKSFIWENISPALPDGIGSIPLEEVCEGGTLDYITHFEDYLLPEESRVYTKPPRVFVHDEGWKTICSGLLEKGVCKLIPLSEVYHLKGRPIFNGLFGVSKEEMHGDHEVFRLIMNLIPVNKLVRNLEADVCTLPSLTGLGPLELREEEVLVMSSEDIRCFFYLFATPPSWHRFMAFGKEVPSSLVPGGGGEPHFLASRVLPMGFVIVVSRLLNTSTGEWPGCPCMD